MTYFTFSDSGSRCPFPNCPKPSLCRLHRDLVPESLLDAGDYTVISKYFRIRARIGTLIEATPPATPSPASAETRHPGPPTGQDSAAPSGQRVIATDAPSRVAALSIHTICMDCKCVIKQGDESQPISHGICPDCFPARMAQVEAS